MSNRNATSAKELGGRNGLPRRGFIATSVAFMNKGVAMAANPTRGFVQQWSVETHRLLFDNGATRLAIPRNYLEGWLPAIPSIREAAFTGTALLPNFTGAAPDTIGLFRRVDFLQHGGFRFHYASPTSVLLDNAGFFRRGPWLFRQPGIELEPAEYGLFKIKGSRMPLRVSLGATDVESVTVGCNEHTPICEIGLFAEGGNWRTQIGRQFYPQWQNTIVLLREFLRECAKAAS